MAGNVARNTIMDTFLINDIMSSCFATKHFNIFTKGLLTNSVICLPRINLIKALCSKTATEEKKVPD